jgi:NADH dehydrogenase
MGLRAEKKAEMRAAIIETSLMLFRRVGFHRARVHDVIEALHISEATFFNYFPTKQSVLEAAAEALLSRSVCVLRAELDDVDRPVQERLELVTRQFASNFDGDRELAVLLARHTRLLLIGSDRNTEGRALLARLFTSGQERGQVRAETSPNRLADLYLGASLATINGWILDDDDEALEDRLLAAQRIFWTGAAPGPTSPRRNAQRGRVRPPARR